MPQKQKTKKDPKTGVVRRVGGTSDPRYTAKPGKVSKKKYTKSSKFHPSVPAESRASLPKMFGKKRLRTSKQRKNIKKALRGY